MGLNEDGVDILIEELGVEEFAEFVYDISEEYVLAEARAGGARIEPVTAKGQKFKSGKPTGKSLARLRAQKEARKSAEEKASASKPSGLKASLQRQSAVATAAKKQPKKPGIFDRVVSAVDRGIARHNAAMGELQKMKAATAVTAGKVKKAAGQFKKGFTGEEIELQGYVASKKLEEGHDSRMGRGEMGEPKETQYPKVDKKQYDKDMDFWKSRIRTATAQFRLKKRGKVPKKGGKDMFEHILEHLVAEGYADTNEAAIAIMANMSEEWKQSIVEETKRTEYLQKKFNKENQRKSGSAHTYIPGKQNTGQALIKSRESERHMRGEN